MYDNDVTTWSPQGRIFQIEYAAEAVKQGAVCVGICSKEHVVLAALKVTDHYLVICGIMLNDRGHLVN